MEQVKTEVVRSRVSPTEKIEIEKKAKEAGLNVSEFLRRCALGK